MIHEATHMSCPVSNHDSAPPLTPSRAHTVTRHSYLVRGRGGGPAYLTLTDVASSTRPVDQTGAPAWVTSTRYATGSSASRREASRQDSRGVGDSTPIGSVRCSQRSPYGVSLSGRPGTSGTGTGAPGTRASGAGTSPGINSLLATPLLNLTDYGVIL